MGMVDGVYSHRCKMVGRDVSPCHPITSFSSIFLYRWSFCGCIRREASIQRWAMKNDMLIK